MTASRSPRHMIGSLAPLIVLLALIAACRTPPPPAETVLDRVVNLHEELVLDVPEVPRWCDRLGLEPMRVSVGDAELHVEIEGQGLPMILLHGGPGGTHHYFHPTFSRAAEFSRVVYYDQRGCGLSAYTPGDGYTIQQAADDLEALRLALDIHRWVVVGFSYGGLLAQVYATRYETSLAGLVLVSSSFAPHIEDGPSRQHDFISDPERERMGEINEMRGLTRQQLMFNRYLAGDWKRQFFCRPSPERLAEMARYEWVHDPAFRRGVLASIDELDLDGVFHEFVVPTLLFEAQWDLTWSADKPAAMQREFPNAQFLYFERSGHSLYADEPDRFFSELRRFVTALPQP